MLTYGYYRVLLVFSLNITVGMQLLLHSISLRVQLWHLKLDRNTCLRTVRMLFVSSPRTGC